MNKEGSVENYKTVKRRYMYTLMLQCNGKLDEMFKFMEDELIKELKCSKNDMPIVKQHFRRFKEDKIEINYIEKQIGELTKSEYITTDSNIVLIKHTLFPTMVDGKVCNAATETSSSMRCYICQATSKTFNNLDKRNEENPASFKFGMSPLHLRIRCFETILHLSYKLPLKTWQARTTEEKKVVSDRKAEIQSKMKEELGLLVDIPVL